MELDTIEKEDRLILDLKKNHTVANLIRKAIWENGGEAGYDKGHPLGEESNLVIKADDPEQVLEDAVETAQGWLDELDGQLE
ncbi:MAG: RpoL/Rpb11 RNA polymerase subunit family protein [Candidatus Nanohaloarchaea archaeon]